MQLSTVQLDPQCSYPQCSYSQCAMRAVREQLSSLLRLAEGFRPTSRESITRAHPLPEQHAAP